MPPILKKDSSLPTKRKSVTIVLDNDDDVVSPLPPLASPPTAASEGDDNVGDASVDASSFDNARAAAKNSVRRSKRIASEAIRLLRPPLLLRIIMKISWLIPALMASSLLLTLVIMPNASLLVGILILLS